MKVFVGTALVLSCPDDGRPSVRILGDEALTIVADWAVPFRYQPARGDLLQVIGRQGRYWVTGVLHGRGRSTIAFHGDGTLTAQGNLRLRGDNGVHVSGPTIRVETQHLESEAEMNVQRVGEMDSRVSGRIDERAGECARVIDEEDEQIAARHETVARRAVKIDAELLRLS